MVDAEDALKLTAVLLFGLGAMTLVAAVDMQGTQSYNPFSSEGDEPRYVLNAEVGVEAATLSTDGIRISDDSFRYSVEEQGLIRSLSVLGPGSDLSLLTAEDVTMDYTLHGPMENPVTNRDELGDIGTISDSELSTFRAGNLPCGSYVLHMDLHWNTGQDHHEEELQIECTEGENR